MSVNKVTLIGRLGADPEFRSLESGSDVATASIATSKKWKDKDGKDQEKAEWHRVVVWGKRASSFAKYLFKGSQVYIEGELSTRTWEDKDGVTRYTTEIIARDFVFLTPKSAGGDRAPEPSFDENEEIPF